MTKHILLLLLSGMLLWSFLGCFSPKNQPTQASTPNHTFQEILANPTAWDHKELSFAQLRVDLKNDCQKIYRQGGICVTDGTASLCARGKLPPGIPTRPGERYGQSQFLSKEKLQRQTFHGTGILFVNKLNNEVMKKDNIAGGTLECREVNNNKICFVQGGFIVYIKFLQSGWNNKK